MYIRYEPENGKILSISNVKDDTLIGRYGTIDIFTAKDFIDGVKNENDYVVVPDLHDPNKVKLINTQSEQIDYDISKNIYQLPKTTVKSSSNFIIYQTPTGWRIEISDFLKSVISTSDFYTKKVYNFYITDQNDPNVLLDKFTIKLTDLLFGAVEIQNIDTSVCKRSDISVYAYREFDTYEHVVQL